MFDMRENLSIRSYIPVTLTHSHQFHQIVVPLHGAIEISVNDFVGVIGAGQCVIIQKDIEHSFKAKKDASFLVANLWELPDSAMSLQTPFAAMSRPFRSFCLFAEIQLNSRLNVSLEDSMISVFKQLLSHHDFQPEPDRRIARALAHIDSDISRKHTLSSLASVSALSVSQFKKLFEQHTGTSVGQHILALRMEKARALLVNTDTPVNLVAEKTGYSDQSAFTRRFSAYFGTSPTHYKKR